VVAKLEHAMKDIEIKEQEVQGRTNRLRSYRNILSV
jgi:hypothetical protein